MFHKIHTIFATMLLQEHSQISSDAREHTFYNTLAIV